MLTYSVQMACAGLYICYVQTSNLHKAAYMDHNGIACEVNESGHLYLDYLYRYVYRMTLHLNIKRNNDNNYMCIKLIHVKRLGIWPYSEACPRQLPVGLADLHREVNACSAEV